MHAVVSEKLAGACTWTAKTRDGVAMLVRPLRPNDVEREKEFVSSLSEQARYFRLFTALKEMPESLLAQLMDIDYDRKMALVASIQRNGKEHFIGIARYAPTSRPEVAEFAVAVLDAWQGRGVATLLITALMRFAVKHGFRWFTGVVLPENERMLKLARSLDFDVTYHSDEHLMRITGVLPER